MTKKAFLFIILCLFSSQHFLSAQEKDFELRQQIQLELDLSDNIELQSENGVRISDNMTRLRTIYTKSEMSYSLLKWLELSISYRFKRSEENYYYYINEHRFHTEIDFEYDIKRFEFGYRSRVQLEYFAFSSSPTGKIPCFQNRNKFSVEYNIKKNPLSPYMSFESYYMFGDYWGNKFDKHKIVLGTAYKINKKISLDLFLHYYSKINTAYPWSRYVIGVEYEISLN